MIVTQDRLLAITSDMRSHVKDLLILERRTGLVKGMVKNFLGINVLSSCGPCSFYPIHWGLSVKPVDDVHMLVLADDRMGLYELDAGEVIWESDKAGPFKISGTVWGSKRPNFPLLPGALALGDGICAATADDYSAVRIFSLNSGKLLGEFSVPPGWGLGDWFMEEGR